MAYSELFKIRREIAELETQVKELSNSAAQKRTKDTDAKLNDLHDKIEHLKVQMHLLEGIKYEYDH